MDKTLFLRIVSSTILPQKYTPAFENSEKLFMIDFERTKEQREFPMIYVSTWQA
jgi:hypothetical protein